MTNINGIGNHSGGVVDRANADGGGGPSAQVTAPASASGRRVMIVEDEAMISLGIAGHLQRMGHTVVAQVSTAAHALREYRAQRPDVVLLDIQLDGADGIDVAREMQAIRRCTMLIISAYSHPQLVERASDAGVYGYLIKPIVADALSAQIEVAVRRSRETEELIERNAQLMQSLENRKLVEQAKGIYMKRLALDEREAHRRLQQESQKRRISIAELAKKVIESAELLDG